MDEAITLVSLWTLPQQIPTRTLPAITRDPVRAVGIRVTAVRTSIGLQYRQQDPPVRFARRRQYVADLQKSPSDQMGYR